MLAKNIYGEKVMITFGDYPPDTKWEHLADGQLVVIGTNDGLNDVEHFGKFTDNRFQQVLAELEQFKQEYTWIPLLYKWIPNHMVDKSWLE